MPKAELHEIIAIYKYKSALEIGTSTGHSEISIAYALSINGSKLVATEIDWDCTLDLYDSNKFRAGIAEFDIILQFMSDLLDAKKLRVTALQ